MTPGTARPESAPPRGVGELHIVPIGNNALDAWFVPAGAAGVRLRLWRDPVRVEPGAVFERAARDELQSVGG
jgi:hypothetical protein